ncbi:tetratricopeptide repeat protein [Rodentibacter caecimuris]|uniref:tetratricopeptide repeat protein n=1 Tax=Rodentibacter caecimuris TaxID=1796644 RepID=UPI001EFB04D5
MMNNSANELTLRALTNTYINLIGKEDYDEAKRYAETLCLLAPQNIENVHKLAYIYLKQEKWQDAIDTGLKAISLNNQYVPTLDLLAHAYGAISDWENAGHYGHQALVLRDAKIPTPTAPMPIGRSVKGGKNLIAFSLFGKRSKYIETAVLNVQVAHALFPNWICRFYIDDSVPENAVQRLKENGAEIIKIAPPLKTWPGAMWRFLAINDPEAEYVIFRDADSVISPRESVAVAEWIKSGRSFHTMRDSGSHTALILAGMWGAKANSVSNMEERIQNYINKEYDSAHFADQDFLADELWGYIRQDLWAHDRLFNFCDAKPFPELPFNSEYQIAFCEGGAGFIAKTEHKEGTQVKWTLYSSISPLLNTDYSSIIVPEFKVCSYQTAVKNGEIADNIPRRYAYAFKKGLARIEIENI